MAAGDITYSNPGAQSGDKAFASGLVSADADTAINVLVGFVPSMVQLVYKDTAATTYDREVRWFKGMPVGYMVESYMDDGAAVLQTSGGPTVYGDTTDDAPNSPTGHGTGYAPAGTHEETSGTGFTIPAAFMQTDEDVIYWVAWR